MLGEGSVVFEKARVGVADIDSGRPEFSRRTSGVSLRNSTRGDGVVLGRNVVVETNAIVEAAEVGEGSVVEVGAVVGRGAVVGKVCVDSLFVEVVLISSSIAQSQQRQLWHRTQRCQTIQLYSAVHRDVLIRHYSNDRTYSKRRWQCTRNSWRCSDG